MSDDTRSERYADRLRRLSGRRWKRWLNVQAPYRWNLRRLGLGFTLDVGCGIGRNLAGIDGVGVDHNAEAVRTARERGLIAFEPDEFHDSEYARPGRFDAMLLAHVVEHMTMREAEALIGVYLPFVRPGGTVVLIAPQEAGFRSDDTHVEYADFSTLDQLLRANDVSPTRAYSFPFPRFAGRVFRHNEFVVVGTL